MIGTQELVIVLVIALILFGPSRLPELGNSVGKAIKSFKEGMDEVTQEPKKEEKKDATEISAKVEDSEKK
ncbi:Sec-independent protein translocase protein tatA/E-like protein [Thermodesulfobium narugense DSM 14796]|uniref:Sec-independent protein translocase protein TatA n=2 Tax=Thermodesulfobium TaxID=227388 RepID=M1E6A1_9BACT|nr:Sec-independent protein translocase protein tatA/E-like protein [Thermodesulfobium narugense DSM 14796]AWB09613.1 sec-independent protein translocase protein TatA [Thermodesulfobium acidiphilum]PMP85349.1 MAG: twin-arginine translocase TatA/TatE family subunit [Thermodesulfobium narugense]HEM56029.1 twin-arginine translocase TatA/TatE family subunit [Thermodesulfobium narugense]